MTERNLLEIHTYMNNEIYAAGGKIDKCYFAPNLIGAEDDMRKPGPAMAELAKMEFTEIEFSRCVMVGDADSDILFGKNLGMKTVRVRSQEKADVPADIEVDGLHELVTKLTHEK
jgi:HAD superfamily hydrolase (TIGR01662 family)